MKTLMVIDDEDIVLKTAKNVFKRYNYEVIAFTNGANAISFLQTNTVDLIICDVRMPGMDGVTTIRSIRELLRNNNRSAIPEIIMTGYAEEEAHRQVEMLKVAGVIYKPFDIVNILECVKKTLAI